MINIDAVFSSTLQKLPEAVLVYDKKGNIRFVNDYGVTKTGYSRETLLQTPIWEIDTRYLTREQFERMCAQSALTDTGKSTSLYRCSDGTLLPVEISASIGRHDEQEYCLVIVHDISERLHRENELNLLQTLIDDSHDMVYVLRIKDGYIHYMNKMAESELGYTLEEQRALGIEGFRRPLKEKERFIEHLEELQETGKMTDYAFLTRKDGSEFPVEVNARVVNHEGTDYNIAIVRDITERVEFETKLKEMNESLEKMVHERTEALEQNMARLDSYKQALNANSIVSISDTQGNITYVNDNFCRVSGYTFDELIGKPHNIVRHPDTPKELFKDLWKTIKAKNIWLGILKNRKKDGSPYYVNMAIQPILDADGEIVEYMAIRHEVTKLIEREEEIKRQAFTDVLTGFGSRLKLIEDIKEHPSPMLAYLDIDEFSSLNDFYGHEFGDRLIKHFADMLSGVFAYEGSLYRLHGDKFGVLVHSSLFKRFERLIKDFTERFNKRHLRFEEQELSLRITTSLSCVSDENLISTCDLALRHAKTHSLPFVVYSRQLGLEEELRTNLSCSVRLRNAMADDRIEVYCQPIADARSRNVRKYECLVRLIDEEGQVISPFYFLEAAKRSKQYAELSKTVIRKSFDLIDRYPDRQFTINITMDDVLNEEAVELILERLEAKRSEQTVIFELVESEGIENFEDVTGFIHAIKARGCKLAIDDFGTGYSNFEYLLRINADFIKIDGSLIKNIDSDENIRSIVELIIGFAKRQNIETVAEFVESEIIADTVEKLGVDYLQGYHIGKPAPMSDE